MFKDSFTARGIVKVRKFNIDTNETVYEHTDNNLIVKLGRTEMAKLITGESKQAIDKMAIGKGGADPANPFKPLPPTSADIGLKSQVRVEKVSSAKSDSSLTNPTATYIAVFDSSKVNSIVNECALMFADGSTMFSRHTFKSVPLESDEKIAMEVTWTIEF